jgi:hypothetical protein
MTPEKMLCGQYQNYALESVQSLQSWLHKAASSIIANPIRCIYNHIRKGDGKFPPPQIFS